MSTTTSTVSVKATVYLTEDESQEIPFDAPWIKSAVHITKAYLTYRYEGEYRGWVLSETVVYFHRIKKDGGLYKEEQVIRVWTSSVPEDTVKKHMPGRVPVITWTEE